MSGDIGLNMYEQSFHYQSEPLASNYHSEYNNELPSHQYLRTIIHNLHHLSRPGKDVANRDIYRPSFLIPGEVCELSLVR